MAVQAAHKIKASRRGTNVLYGYMLQQGFQIAQSWEKLTDVIRTGKPVIQIDDSQQGPSFWVTLLRGLYAPSYISGKLLLSQLDMKRDSSLQVLDVAAGSTAWSLPLAEQLGAQVAVVDLPPVVEKKFLKNKALKRAIE